MGLKVELDATELTQDLKNVLNEFKTKTVVQAARRAINRSLIGVRQKSLDDIRKQFNVKERDLRKRMAVHRATGGTLETLVGSVSYSLESFPMIGFVKGSKAPIAQKGIPVKRRRKLKAQIEKGKTIVLKRAFIQKGPKSTQVFKSRKAGGFKKQGVRSIGHMVEKRGLGDKFATYGAKRFRAEFLRELQVRAQGIVKTADITNAK